MHRPKLCPLQNKKTSPSTISIYVSHGRSAYWNGFWFSNTVTVKEKASYLGVGVTDQVSLQMGWVFSMPATWIDRDFEQRTQKVGFWQDFSEYLWGHVSISTLFIVSNVILKTTFLGKYIFWMRRTKLRNEVISLALDYRKARKRGGKPD